MNIIDSFTGYAIIALILQGRNIMRRLYRSRANKMLMGVCGGLGDYFKMDPNIVRVIFIIMGLMGGFAVVMYVVMMIFIPEDPEQDPFDF